MPTVPTLSSPQIQPPRMPGVRLDENVPNVGAGLARGADQLAGILEQERLRADRTAVTAADTTRESWANTRLYDPQNGAFNREGKNALGVTNEVLGDFDKHVQETAGTLNGRRQTEAFLQSSSAQRVALQGQLSRFEFEQRGKYEDQTANARMSTAIESGSLNYNDPTTLGQSRQAILDTLKSQKAAKGWDDETLVAANLSKLTDLHSSVIERMLADGKTGAAKKYLAASKAELTAGHQLTLSRAIDAAEREQRNELAASVRQRVADLSASYKAGLPVPIGQELSSGTLETVFPGKGQEIWSSLQADKRMGADLKDLNQQSPAQMQATLGKYAVTQGGSGAHDALERQGDLERAARASIEARTKNPAQFAIDNGLGYKPLPSNPDEARRELQNREAVRGQASQTVGMAVPMLTPDEAKRIGQGLAVADDKTAVQTFDYLRQSVGDSAYTSIMQQVAPDSPVKAYAGQIYGKAANVTLATHLFSPDDVAPARVVAQTLVTGENLINKTKQVKTEDGKPVSNLYLPNKAQFDAAFADRVGDAFAGRPEAQSLALQVAYAYYVGKSAQIGRLNSDSLDIDSKLVQESLRASVGETVSYHGYGNVLLPLGMDESTFNDRAKAAFAAELDARVGGRLSPQDAFARNRAYAKQQPSYLTTLSPDQEQAFQAWAKKNSVPFDPSSTADYDMRGFYKGMMAGDSHAQTGQNRNDGKLHFNDYYKTPYHQSFSAESQFATEGAPRWNAQDQLVAPDGKVVFDEPAFVAKQRSAESQVGKAIDSFGSFGLRNLKANQYLVTKGREPFSIKGQPIVITVAP